MIRQSLSALATALLLASCATAPKPVAYQPFGLLAFGDHGYHLGYLDAEDREPPRTQDQFLAAERADWLEDKRPPAEFEASPMTQLDNGGYVAASGMMPVAKAMKDYCATAKCDAAVMLGDNIYPDGATGGADGRDDAKRFEDILRAPYRDFGQLAEGFRIYAALGNHDWRTSREAAMAQVRYMETTPPFYMDGIVYAVKPPAAHGDVEIFVIDTHVLLSGQTVHKAILADDGSEVPTTRVDTPTPWAMPQTDIERDMVQWLDTALSRSTARWKIVIGHHPIWSSAGSKFEQAKVLRRLILPTLCRHADLYLAGHEHTLEVQTDNCATAVPEAVPALPQVVSGAAAKQRPLNTAFMAHQNRNNPQMTPIFAKGMVWGYAHISLEADQAVVRVLSTPDDGSGTSVPEITQTFERRSGRLR